MAAVIYFFDQEAEYGVWLEENFSKGLVVSNLKGENIHYLRAGFPSKDDAGGLRLHRASCGFLRRRPDVESGTRTKTYGKLCGLDRIALIKVCKDSTRKQPIECRCMGRFM